MSKRLHFSKYKIGAVCLKNLAFTSFETFLRRLGIQNQISWEMQKWWKQHEGAWRRLSRHISGRGRFCKMHLFDAHLGKCFSATFYTSCRTSSHTNAVSNAEEADDTDNIFKGACAFYGMHVNKLMAVDCGAFDMLLNPVLIQTLLDGVGVFAWSNFDWRKLEGDYYDCFVHEILSRRQHYTKNTEEHSMRLWQKICI